MSDIIKAVDQDEVAYRALCRKYKLNVDEVYSPQYKLIIAHENLLREYKDLKKNHDKLLKITAQCDDKYNWQKQNSAIQLIKEAK